ncbi:19638_t:CDS:2 [Gigaspora margarita]|uniref:19638_t:CDS:1 n=1 Tax=Gigaspora margarita TaxID=4874 RepID=A0ABN7VI94_GIGMA|nr:19638_t:CDS:2 [Gigaspora margarita]
MIKNGGELAEMINSCNKVIYVDNPIENNVARNKSRSILLQHLATCQEVYRPQNLRKLTEKVGKQINEKEQLVREKKDLEKLRKKVATKLAEGKSEDEKGRDLLEFVNNKKLDICFAKTLFSHYPLNFGGFYQRESQDQRPLKSQYRKLGYEKYFATPEGYLEIDLANLLKTCSHELAHYIQFVKWGESSCESDLGTDKYVVELAKEHEEWTGEIYQMVNANYSY